jgi:hypothetical protein
MNQDKINRAVLRALCNIGAALQAWGPKERHIKLQQLVTELTALSRLVIPPDVSIKEQMEPDATAATDQTEDEIRCVICRASSDNSGLCDAHKYDEQLLPCEHSTEVVPAQSPGSPYHISISGDHATVFPQAGIVDPVAFADFLDERLNSKRLIPSAPVAEAGKCVCGLAGTSPICTEAFRNVGRDYCGNRLESHPCAHSRACHAAADAGKVKPANKEDGKP